MHVRYCIEQMLSAALLAICPMDWQDGEHGMTVSWFGKYTDSMCNMSVKIQNFFLVKKYNLCQLFSFCLSDQALKPTETAIKNLPALSGQKLYFKHTLKCQHLE